MKRSISFLLIIFMVLISAGCATIWDIPKTFWGSSTRALEAARDQASNREFACNMELCFEDVLQLAEEQELVVYIEDRRKWLIVLMGFKKSIDTTEVGVFFTALGSKATKIEVVSLSPTAEHTASKLIFSKLDKIYTDAP